MIFSLWRSSGLLHTVWALWERMWITLNLAERWWWLSHCRYLSVWVGFLHTMMDRFPSASGLTIVSKKGMAPSSLLFSTVNWMAGSTLLMCCRKSCLWISLWMKNVSSTYLHQNLEVGSNTESLFSKYSIHRLATIELTGETIATPSICSKNWSWNEKYVFVRQSSNSRVMSSTGSTVLSLRMWSFSNRSLMTFRAESTGTEVNRADTS